jgi:hypothetical protein
MEASNKSGSAPGPGGTVVIVAAVLGMAGLAFVFLLALLGPMFFQIVGIGLALCAFGGMHYWLWGRSMPEREPPDDGEIR